MAEIKTGIFAKNVQKRLSRAQEKVLQKLGKADETKDEQFEQCVQNFKRQEFEGSRLQREMRTYLAAVKAMQQASMSLTESLHEVYEPDWHGRDDVMTIGKNCDELWEDFHERLVDSTVSALENYLTQFPDLKIRVSKRARKLIDYDSARHHLETMQVTNQSNQRKILKAEDDLKKAQKVFDDLNVGLQDELPTLWDSRVGFYVNTFKSVTSLEAKFHREISVLCHKLYEVMNKLAEQHSDKMFTIQGAPRFKRDSGPLRLARTPTPPDDSDPDSPDATPNHMLRLASPGPPRPKSPSMSEDQKKGPPRPPKATPTKELMQEQIIDLFGGSFPMASSSSQPNEGPVESLLDLDFDPFPSSTPIGQSQSPMPQTLPWDMWTEEVPAAQPQVDSGSWASGAPSQGEGEREASVDANPSFSAFPAFPDQGGDTGFTVDWSANFSAPAPVTEGAAAADASVDASADAGADASADASVDASADASAFASTSADAAADAAPASDGWPPSSGWATEATQPQVETVSNNAFNGFPQTDASASAPAFAADFDKMPEGVEGAAAPAAAEAPEAPEAPEAAAAAVGQVTEGAEGQVTTPPAPAEAAEASETTAASPPGEKAPTPAESPVSADNVEGAQSEIPKGDECEKEQPTQKAPESAPVPEAAKESPTAETPASAEDKGSPIEEAPAEVAKPEGESSGTEAQAQAEPGQEAGTVEAKAEAEAEEAASAAGAKPVEWAADSVSEEEKMPIPSVVIEPASSNEGDDDRDVDILSPATSDNGVAPIPDLSSGLPGMPPGFLYKVEAMHDFDAENTDELNLKMGDLVFVIPTKQTADQEAGWLTGIREADWLQQGASAKSGLFPDNFTTRVE
ncbi:amphiphysin isoform X10 [Clupea harengus]|uniref:Amphiphysin isoform X10 n=1 Tax=Clupea harengus TaxID=7950 RepID=A0A6P8ERW8_CLUHA|nr:amphiphysin isoform X10 [Clupea harengus]